MLKLQNKARKELLLQHKKERDGRIKDRIKAILLYDKKKTIPEIAECLFLSSSTINRYIEEYFKNERLTPLNKGTEGKLSKNEARRLSAHIEDHTYTKVEEIANYILITYGIKYTVSGLTKWLKKAGFVYKKPKGIPSKLNEQAQASFISKYIKLSQELSKDEKILFLDSCHPTQSTKLEYGWIKKGQEKQIKTTGSRTRMNITGAIDIKTRAVIKSNYEKINGESTVNFLKKIVSTYPEAQTINVILDQASYHKSKEVISYVKTTNIKLHYLPPYSPNLNPIERLWKIMHEYVRNNKYFESAKEFRASINEFFESTIPEIKEVLRNRINSNFQIITNSS